MPDFFGAAGPWDGVGAIAGFVFMLVVLGAVFDWLEGE